MQMPYRVGRPGRSGQTNFDLSRNRAPVIHQENHCFPPRTHGYIRAASHALPTNIRRTGLSCRGFLINLVRAAIEHSDHADLEVERRST